MIGHLREGGRFHMTIDNGAFLKRFRYESEAVRAGHAVIAMESAAPRS